MDFSTHFLRNKKGSKLLFKIFLIFKKCLKEDAIIKKKLTKMKLSLVDVVTIIIRIKEFPRI
jgi:hypothetical protein